MATNEDRKTLVCRSVITYVNAESNFQSRMEISNVVEISTREAERWLLNTLKSILKSKILESEPYVKSIEDIDIININTLW